MEAIGLLAGGIAHDFNNLLTAINGYSELTLRKLKADDPLRANIIEVRNAGERAAALTSQLLAFSRKQVLKPKVHNVNSVITEIERMLRRIIRESIEFEIVLAPDLGNIKADPGRIEQVIMNLAVNARDAMQNEGKLTIETKNVYLDTEEISQSLSLEPGPYIKMSVKDTGHGMDEETRKRIFEPFFTTKEIGKGTGLGLSTVHGIIRQSGGDIVVSSVPGVGTTFDTYLPCVDENIEVRRIGDDGDELYVGTETILLVEDDEIVRNLVRDMLADQGYKVLEAANGKRALTILDNYRQTVHLLLSDIIMPGMNGGELGSRVTELRPGIKVLFMSGYSDEPLPVSGVTNLAAAFLEKPFTPDGLSQKVRAVLES
jgi:CheY-like chemotaxis protein